MNRLIHTATAFTLLASTASIAMTPTETFRARGNEPFWSVEKTADAITFRPMEGEPLTVTPAPAPRTDGDAEIYEAMAGGKPFVLTVSDAVCTDTMSGMPFPNTVTLAIGAETFEGCGGEPMSLVLGEWTIAGIDGKPPVAESTPTLAFDAEGKVSGNGSCNRFFGSYTLTGEGLTVGEVGSSMMMCDEPLMDQERVMFDILAGVARFEIGTDGVLILHDHDGRTISGHRAE